MEHHRQLFDVCVVCALPEEVKAFIAVVKLHCENDLDEHISPRYGYSYRSASLKNDKDEVLTLHISWLPRYGPQEMTLHLSRVLEEYQPRIVIMTGICAGDPRHVQLGDLVVAERTFTYDNGKFILDGSKQVHLHDTLTYQLDAKTLQFLGLFDDWKPLVARLKRPPSPPEQGKRRKIACHIKPMASGNAVRADHPFDDIQAPVRGTVAIDMEGAAFGLVMSRHPLIPWLVVKGVCDYADQNKNDAYHDYAARASALYALSFIRAYVTDEYLPRRDEPSPPHRVGSPGVWNIPHPRNPHFTGRDDLLDRLHQQLTTPQQNNAAQTRRVALTQPLAVKGLGGIGKTQIAVEYVYRAHAQGHYTHTLWVNAATEEAMIASYKEIAELLPSFAAKDEADQ
jgi:nucleoside phosphorylase